MIQILEPMNGEIRQEAATTKRVLERVPIRQTNLEASSEIDVARPTGDARGDHSRRHSEDCAGGRVRSERGEFQSALPKSKEEILTLWIRASKPHKNIWRRERIGRHGNWRAMANGKEVMSNASRRDAPIDHAQSLVSPSRAIVGLPAIAGCPGASDLWPQRG
jgi:hypothetical protein